MRQIRIQKATPITCNLEGPTPKISQGMCHNLVRNARFELLVMLTLLASSATLGVETHVAMQDIHSAARPIQFRAVLCS